MPTPNPLRRPVLVALASAAAALGVAAPMASADSIAYVKGGDLWLSTPDGSRQFQVTTTGGYSTVSQSDLGKLVALHGDRIRTLDTEGRVLHDIATPASSSMPGTNFRGPFDPAVSPDGMKIAYTWYYTERSETPSCNPSTGCQVVYGRQGTGYTRPDRITGFDEHGFQSQSGWVGPSWHVDGETLLSDPIQVGNEQVVVHTPGDEFNKLPGGLSRWFSNSEARGLRDGEMSRDETKVAFVTGDANDLIHIYRANGGHPHMPEACFQVSGPTGRYQSPSWAPDGSKLAYVDGAGLHTIPLPDMSTSCGKATEDAKLLIPGATYVDWGRSDVPPARTTPPGGQTPGGQTPGGQTPGGQTPGGQTPGGQGGGGTPTAVRLTASPTKLRIALRRGLTVRLTGARPGTRRITASSGRTVVASGTARVAADGTGRVTLRFTAKAKRRLADRQSVKLVLRGAGASRTVTLKR